jgi:hypothetical protein
MTLQQSPELGPCSEKLPTTAAPHGGALIRRLRKDHSRRVAVGTAQVFRHRVLRSIAMQ